MTVVLAIALGLAALAYVLLVRESDIPEPVPVSPVQYLDDRKQAIYDNLRDLQFEYRLGKLSDEDYQATKQSLQKELAVVLAETETVMKQAGLTPVRGARGTVAKPPAANTKTSCPSCGAQFAQSFKFCGECGKAIA